MSLEPKDTHYIKNTVSDLEHRVKTLEYKVDELLGAIELLLDEVGRREAINQLHARLSYNGMFND